MKNRKTFLIIAVSAVIVAVFLLVNFRAAFSNTGAETIATTVSSGDTLPDAMQQRAKITLVVIGEGPLAPALEKSLVKAIGSAGLGEVELVHALDADYPNPVLVIDVGRPGVLWTPVFGSSSFSVDAWYASNGDTTGIDAESVGFDNTDGPGIITSTEYQVRDSSYGIMSRPGYYQLLADWLANSIVEALSKLYQPKL